MIRSERFNLLRMPIWELLLGLSIILLPYDAIKYLPSAYRPLSLIPICILFLFAVADSKYKLLNRNSLVLFVFLLYSLISSAVSYSTNNKIEFLDFVVTITIGVVTFISISYGLFKKRATAGFEGCVLWFFKMLGKAFLIPLIVGCIEALSLFGPLPSRVNELLVSIFGGNQLSRLCLTSYEASWASMQMIYIAPVYMLLYTVTKKRGYLVEVTVSVCLLLLTGSLQGLVSAVCAFVLFPFMLAYSRGDLYQLFKKIIPIIILVAITCVLFYLIIMQMPDSYVKKRIISFVDISSLIRSDASSLIRICYPLLCFSLIFMNPLFGTGGGSFPLYLPDMVKEKFPWALNGTMPEITRQVSGVQSISSMCLYTRVIGELGIIGSALFFSFILSCIKNIKRFSSMEEGPYVVFWVSVALCLMIQFQSFAYIPFWTMLAFLSSVSGKYN